MRVIADLRAVVYAMHQKDNINRLPPEIVEIEPQLWTDFVDKMNCCDGELIRAVHKFNNWCTEVGEKLVKLINPVC